MDFNFFSRAKIGIVPYHTKYFLNFFSKKTKNKTFCKFFIPFSGRFASFSFVK